MKKPLPTSIPSIIPAAVLAEAKKKKLIYVGTGDEEKNMFKPAIRGRYWEEGRPERLTGEEKIIGFFKTFHFFLPRKTAAKFFDLPKAPKNRFFKNGNHRVNWGRNVVLHKVCADGRQFEIFKDGTEEDAFTNGFKVAAADLKSWTEGGSWVELSAAEAKSYLASFKKPAPTALELLTAENALLKARIAKLEAAIRDASKAL